MSEQQRHIAHFDLDSFFVSVEVLKDPSLKGKPVIVGGSAERGVVSTCSYEARQFGVKSAMPMKTALQRCPQAIVLQGSYADYADYSERVTQIIAAKAPLFEKASIDEFYIDLTGMDVFDDPLHGRSDCAKKLFKLQGCLFLLDLPAIRWWQKLQPILLNPMDTFVFRREKKKNFWHRCLWAASPV